MNHFFMHAPKWRTGAGVLTLLVWLASCGPNNKTVEYPLIETANTNALDIAKVELTDSATILHTDAYYRPHNWIRISSVSASRGKTVYADRCRRNHSGLAFLDA